MIDEAHDIAAEMAMILQQKCTDEDGKTDTHLMTMAAVRMAAVVASLFIEKSDESLAVAVQYFEHEMRHAMRQKPSGSA